MESRRIELSDLVNLKDGTTVDVSAVTDVQDPAYNLVKEEVDDFAERPRKQPRAVAADFYNRIPATDLKNSIDKILKTRNTQEERIKRHMQFDFDRKMQRINRIKSKTYRRLQRRDKIRKEQALQVSGEEESEQGSGSEAASECSPVLEFKHDGPEESEPEQPAVQFEMVKKAFQDPEIRGNEKDFLEEKSAAVEADAPKVLETVLLGWDDWAGEGIEVKKTRHNTITERREGIRNHDRKDFNKNHVIINEHVEIPDKYRSQLPYGYSAKDYNERIRMPVSAETNSLRVFKRLIKMNRGGEEMPGKNIKPAEFEPEY